MNNTPFRRLATALLVAFAAWSVSAEDAIDAPDDGRKLALVLSGGGARGTAHVGVLKALEELRIVPDLIVGTSMGSIVGGLYAAGWSPDEMEELLSSMDWNEVFTDDVPRRRKSFRRKQDDRPALIRGRVHFKGLRPYVPQGILGGQRLELLMDALEAESATAATLDELNVPFRAVAADISTGEPVVIVDAELSTAMRASMSIPGAFAPVELDGRRLVDGGTVANLPIGIAKELGATAVIAVDISTPLEPDQQNLSDILSILNQTNSMMALSSRDRELRLLGDDDVLIRPDLGDISFVDFQRSGEAADLGAAATRAMSDELSRFSVDEATWQAFLGRQRRRPRGPITIDRVRVENTAPIDDAVVLRALSIEPPARYDSAVLLTEIMQLHSLRMFGIIDFDLEDTGTGRELVVRTPARPAGRGSVQFGLGFSDDFNGDTGYTVTARHQLLPVNRRGGEWQNIVQLGTVGIFDSQFYQPLDAAMRWFVEPSAGFRRVIADLWAGGTPVVQYQIESLEARIAAGRVLGRWGELRATAFTGDYKAVQRIGSPLFPSDDERRGGLVLGFRVDTVDRVTFPRRGSEVDLSYERSAVALGAENHTERATLRAAHAVSFGRFTIAPHIEVGKNFEPTLDYLNLYKLGGLGRLSGLGDDELLGEKMVFGRIMGYGELFGFRAAGLAVEIYAGLSLEAGNVYTRDDSITGSSLRTAWSAFVGADTPLGPVYLGYGRGGDRSRFYLLIGDRF